MHRVYRLMARPIYFVFYQTRVCLVKNKFLSLWPFVLSLLRRRVPVKNARPIPGKLAHSLLPVLYPTHQKCHLVVSGCV